MTHFPVNVSAPWLRLVLPWIVISVITFPLLSPTVEAGLDPSYMWAFNHLFAYDYDFLQKVIFPYGPLGFLKMPMFIRLNYELSLAFHVFIKAWFCLACIATAYRQNTLRYLFSIIVIFTLATLPTIDFFLIGVVFIHAAYYLKSYSWWHLLLASSIAAVSFSIKISIGISCFSILCVAIVASVWSHRRYRRALLDLSFCLSPIFICGSIIFGGLSNFYHFVMNAILLSGDFSSTQVQTGALSWGLLALSGICLLVAPFLTGTKTQRYQLLLIFPAIFAFWKHSISRQDISHTTLLLYFLILVWGIILLLVSNRKLWLFAILSIVSITTAYNNLFNVAGFERLSYSINGFRNIKTQILQYSNFKAASLDHNLEVKRNLLLPDTIRNQIGNETVDIYPWHLLIAFANDLNWYPRNTIMGFFTPKIDTLQAQLFSRDYGPCYYYWHANELSLDHKLFSLDGRYLLNENPISTIKLLNNYNLLTKGADFILFKKNSESNFTSQRFAKFKEASFDEWITVPQTEDILRLNLYQETTPNGSLKNILFRPQQFFVDYAFDDGEVLSYSYQPQSAEKGIWIHPFIRYLDSDYKGTAVQSIRFRCSESKLVKECISYQFEFLGLSEQHENAWSLFKMNSSIDTLLNLDLYAQEANATSLYDVPGSGYSKALTIDTDSLWDQVSSECTELLALATVEYVGNATEALLIHSLSGSDRDFWRSKPLAGLHSKKVVLSTVLDRAAMRRGEFSVVVWNTGKQAIKIKKLVVTLYPLN